MKHPFGTVKDLLDRFGIAKTRKQQWESNLRDCYHYFLPQRDTFYRYAPGQKKSNHLYDSTAQMAIQNAAARIQATICPPWRQWSKLAPGAYIPDEAKDKIQNDLDEVTKIVFDYIHRSNFDQQAHESFLDLLISTGPIVCNEGEGDDLLNFTAVPLAETYLEEGPFGTVDTVWRQHEVEVRNVEQMFKGFKLSSESQKKKTKTPCDKIVLVEGYVYDPKSKLYYHLVIEESAQHLGYEQVDEVCAWAVPRWLTAPGEIYGRGPAMTILADVKTLDKVVEYNLRNAQLAIAGLYTATDDGVTNPYTMRIAPGVVIPVASNDTTNPSIRPLDIPGRFDVSQLVISDYREIIKKSLFNSMRSAAGPVKSATEIALDNKELVETIGSAFGRLQTEFIERILKRVIFILKKNGKIPDITLDGKQITLKHTSPLATAQDMDDLLTFQQWQATIAPLGPEVLMGTVKIEEIPRWVGKKLGIDQDLIRDDGERNDLATSMGQMVAQAPA